MRNREKETEAITNFKNDVLFKYTFGDGSWVSNDLLKRMIEGIMKIKVKFLKVLNPRLIAEQVEDKDMVLDIRVVTDQDERFNVEIQNAKFTIYDGILFLVSSSFMITNQVQTWEDYIPTIKPIYQIIFVDGINILSPYLIDTYSSRNDYGIKEFANMATRIYVQIPLINTYIELKSLKKFNDVEKMIYIIANGLTGDIAESEVGKMMKGKMDEFNGDKERRLMAYNRIIKKATQEAKIKKAYKKAYGERNKKKTELGEYIKIKENTVMLFKTVYPKEDINFLNRLTINQYDKIFDMLINGDSLEAIKGFVEKDI